MRYLHTMLRVSNLDQSLDFYCNKLGMKEVRRIVNDQARFTLVFLAASDDKDLVEGSAKAGRSAPLLRSSHDVGRLTQQHRVDHGSSLGD